MQRERILTFYIDNEIYGIHTDHIREINQLAPIRLSEPKKQVIIRDRSIPLVCLRTKLDLPQAYFPAHNCVLVLHRSGRFLALIVDGIHQLTHMDMHHLTPLLPKPHAEKLLLGLAHLGQDQVKLIDAFACFDENSDFAAVS